MQAEICVHLSVIPSQRPCSPESTERGPKDAKHATNLFTVEAKHHLGPIFLVALMESDGLPSHVCRSCKRRAFTVEKKLFILGHRFRFPYLTEGIWHSLSKRSFPGTDRHHSQLGCNNPCVSIINKINDRALTVISLNYMHEAWYWPKCVSCSGWLCVTSRPVL